MLARACGRGASHHAFARPLPAAAKPSWRAPALADEVGTRGTAAAFAVPASNGAPAPARVRATTSSVLDFDSRWSGRCRRCRRPKTSDLSDAMIDLLAVRAYATLERAPRVTAPLADALSKDPWRGPEKSWRRSASCLARCAARRARRQSDTAASDRSRARAHGPIWRPNASDP